MAAVDPRVEVIAESDEQNESVRRVSNLRPLWFAALPDEPGIGKSTVFPTPGGSSHERVPYQGRFKVLGERQRLRLNQAKVCATAQRRETRLASTLCCFGLSRARGRR
jgi:hypothetical protein